MALTIGETIDKLHGSLRQYIEATYHIGSPQLIQQRLALLNEPGVIHQEPFIESTPRYQSKEAFAHLGLDGDVLAFFESLSHPQAGQERLFYDPPYEHQAAAVRGALVDRKSLLVMTGTGSGKTECFLLPILGKLAAEAKHSPDSFSGPAVRAMVLYPMNALVNDQLGRLRLMFGDQRVVDKFIGWSGRPARFARYTSRTLYPGVRDAKKDGNRLKSIGSFYVHQLELANGPASEDQARAKDLIDRLHHRGKWPAKDDLVKWYGAKGSRWKNSAGEYVRCVTLPRDAELFTRHEVHAAPADILVTNYSMLEYMMMRPLERPIFDRTRDWLENNPNETFLMVIDESHMYRGAAGAEVALLLRRVRTRLGIPPERFQVVCTSASFKDENHATQFAARLTGKDIGDFAPPIRGELALRSPENSGEESDAELLSSIDLDAFHAGTDAKKREIVSGLLSLRSVSDSGEPIERLLHRALEAYAPMGKLINGTMQAACPIDEIGLEVFPGADKLTADRAVTVLAALGSLARADSNQPGLLPCRVHAFYRGLAGLWVCLDPDCSSLPESQRNTGPAGKLFAQPRDRCSCGASVFELFTCRNCGSAYARAYTDDLMDPTYLWSEPGAAFRASAGSVEELEPLDLLLEEPTLTDATDLASFDLTTGQINPARPGIRIRDVYLPKTRFAQPNPSDEVRPGQFRPCGVCGGRAGFNRSSVQDHQTKGDEPFQSLITEQIHVQAPSAPEPSEFAPLQGRKVLTFSDSRQTAARLAPNLQNYSMRDVMRPLIVYGYARLQRSPTLGDRLNLEYLYLAVLLAAQLLGIRLRPALRATEPFTEMADVRRAIARAAPDDDMELLDIAQDVLMANPPHSLQRAIVKTITDRFYGLESLGLASLCEAPNLTAEILTLPNIPTYAETDDQKLALARMWLRAWLPVGFVLRAMPTDWNDDVYRTHSGKFSASVERFLGSAKSTFTRTWLPELRRLFAEQMSPNKFQLRGRRLSLQLEGDWAYCRRCRATQRPYPNLGSCVSCASDTVEIIDVNADDVFRARKGYYRASTLAALDEHQRNPMSLVAAEHTAQLNAAQADEVFSKAEEHELLFQDVDIGPIDGHRDRTAIDILSCTTTMEVGIDIGALAGVALRNMPPARANYQQRAGRAGRRGTAVATVTAFGSADSHDEHYFSHPDQMIRGEVDDPILNVDNADIAQRHVTAFLLQRYHTDRLPEIAPEDQPQLFAVLGTVRAFRNPAAVLNVDDFGSWLQECEEALRGELDGWLPRELGTQERSAILDNFVDATIEIVRRAIAAGKQNALDDDASNGDEADVQEVPEEEGEEQPVTDPGTEDLLKRLLYEGILPRYAFPTDVATFHVFDDFESTRYRPVFRYAPSQGLSVALSQYAPGKQVWIDNRLWTSGSIYSSMPEDRYEAWQERMLYFECEHCHYSKKEAMANAEKGDVRDCPACGSDDKFGPARHWMRPPGFAHPTGKPEGTSPDDQPAKSYATRAKLTAPTPSDASKWDRFNDQVRTYYLRDHLLVTNRGPKSEGYNYCTKCGRVEPSAIVGQSTVLAPHQKPFPMPRDQACSGGRTATGIVLGTDFITDVLLMSIRVPEPMSLRPGLLATDVALRTVCEALTTTACALLKLEPTELQAEYRPALTQAGQLGHEAEIYLYDTLSGGAGFSRHVKSLGDELFRRALTLLTDCPEGCDRSCYRCLRSYKNKFEHDSLDRFLGAVLLRYLLQGGEPRVDARRLNGFVDLLYEDLCRQDRSDLAIERNASLDVPEIGQVEAPIRITGHSGESLIVAVHCGLTPDYAPTPALRELSEYSLTPVHLVDETLIRLNLPTATRRVIDLVAAS